MIFHGTFFIGFSSLNCADVCANFEELVENDKCLFHCTKTGGYLLQIQYPQLKRIEGKRNCSSCGDIRVVEVFL